MVIGKVPRRPGGRRKSAGVSTRPILYLRIFVCFYQEAELRRGNRRRTKKSFGQEFEVSLPGVIKDKEEDVFDDDFKFESDEEEASSPRQEAKSAKRKRQKKEVGLSQITHFLKT